VKIVMTNLAEAALQNLLGEHLETAGRMVVRMSSMPARTPASIANPTRRIMGKNAAYCFFTSGSTGRPKGVLVEHLNLSNIAQTTSRVVARERVYQFYSFTFDISVMDILMTLSSGATLYVGTEESRNGANLPTFLRENEIECCS